MSITKADEIINQVHQQLALENFKTLISTLTPKCYNLCVLKPGTKLSMSESSCLESCAGQYQQTMLLVSNLYLERLQKDGPGMNGLSFEI
ncbi:hypothetical protein BC833DRAFT_618539 [Globomyces pollinis-pini]|nr:hypothetical protein BC833DRAFT_618539 [Globomyces pollinis-pini]